MQQNQQHEMHQYQHPIKKRLRISSLNEKIKNNDDINQNNNNNNNNILLATPSFCQIIPKIISLKKKYVNQYKKIDQNTTEETPKIYHHYHEIKSSEVCQKKIQNFQQFDKLLQITQRCVDYYKKFIQQKQVSIKIVKQAFIQINDSLNIAFNGIITQVKNKQNEIKNYLQQKQYQLIKIKQQQEIQLSNNLNNVKSVHLLNLLRDYQLNDQINNEFQEELSSYANTLHQFYGVMEKVQRYNYKQGVDETINFINNIISQQYKYIIYEKILNKSLDTSFSFNNNINSIQQLKTNIDYELCLEQSLQECLEHEEKKMSQKKQVYEVETQTFVQFYQENKDKDKDNSNQIDLINKQQNIMRNKINQYQHCLLFC